MTPALIPFLPLAYLIGCFPAGLLVARIYNVDITAQGSGNVGATNVAREVGKKAGITTLCLDVAKGCCGTLLPLSLMGWLGGTDNTTGVSALSVLGLCTILGHTCSLPWLKGGKGVATTLGVLLVSTPLIVVFLSIGTFLGTFFASHIVSLSSITTAFALPAFIYIFQPQDWLVFAVVSLVVTLRHKDNIKRLIKGEEKKFTSKKT